MENIPVIIMSAHPRAKKSAGDCGADSFIAKPFDISELLEQAKKYA